MKAARTDCPVCGKRVPVTTSGTLRRHSTYATVCPQSGSEVPCDRTADVCPRCSVFATYEVKCSDPDGLLTPLDGGRV